jgi:TIR domain
VAQNKGCKVFVSYSRHDEELVKPLAGLLGVGVDDAVFLDVASIKPGDRWEDSIDDAIREASVFVLCWCCAAEGSQFIAHELATALLNKEKRLVPVLFCSTPLPNSLAAYQWIDLRAQVRHPCQHGFAAPLTSTPSWAPVSSPGRMNTGLLAGVSAVLAGLVILAGIYITHKSAPTMASMPSSSPPVVMADNRAKTESPISRSTPAPVAAARTPAIKREVPVAQQPQHSEPLPPAQPSSVIWLVAAGAIVLLTLLIWRSLRRKQRQRQINELAGAVASYFRELGKG